MLPPQSNTSPSPKRLLNHNHGHRVIENRICHRPGCCLPGKRLHDENRPCSGHPRRLQRRSLRPFPESVIGSNPARTGQPATGSSGGPYGAPSPSMTACATASPEPLRAATIPATAFRIALAANRPRRANLPAPSSPGSPELPRRTGCIAAITCLRDLSARGSNALVPATLRQPEGIYPQLGNMDLRISARCPIFHEGSGTSCARHSRSMSANVRI